MASDTSSGPVMLHWHEGLHLLPHHLQQLQRFSADGLASQRLFYTRFAAGIIDLQVDLLKTTVKIKRLKAIMPSGALLDLDHNTSVDTLNVDAELQSQRGSGSLGAVLVHLALPLYSERESNVLTKEHTLRRYRAHERPFFDETRGAITDARPVQLLKYNAQLLTQAAAEKTAHIESIPLVRIQPEGRGAARLDDQFSPPVLRLSGWQPLHDLVGGVLREIQLARGSLTGRLKEGGFDLRDLHGNQLGTLLRLRTANAYAGRLRVLLESDHCAPWEIFNELQAMLGELLAMEPEKQFEPAVFDHNSPYEQFRTVIHDIEELLEPEPSAQYLRLAFMQDGRYLRAIAPAEINNRSHAILCVVSDETQTQVDEVVLDLDGFRLTSRDEITFALRGLRLSRMAAPTGLRGNAQFHYFRIDPETDGGRIWSQVVGSREFLLGLPQQMDIQVAEFAIFLRLQ